jgi:hypothetical protein
VEDRMPAIEFPFVGIALLGAVHGVNPAMGWLFAVSLGLQQRDDRAVWGALWPLALGHALAIAAALIVAAVLGIVLPLAWLRWIAAAALLAFGVIHLTRHWHPRAGGMCVGARELTTWSFLMASAHGAGLMVVPFVLALSGSDGYAHDATMHADSATTYAPDPTMLAHGGHAALVGLPDAGTAAILATLLHTMAYLLVAGGIAFIVYRKLGVRLLRTAWINLNLIWAIVLVITAVLTTLL